MRVLNEERQLLAVFLFILSVLPGGALWAASPIANFVFITDPETIPPGVLSGALTIQAQNETGDPQQSDETIDLEFSSPSPTGEFLSAAGEPVKTVMNKGTANRTFYYRDTSAGAYSLAVKLTGRVSGQSWSAAQGVTVGSGGGASATAPGDAPAAAGSGSSSGASVPPLPADIQAYAGQDRKVLAGQAVTFKGGAVGLSGTPIDNARFLWNYGDGSIGEGKEASHIFRIPGTYTVGLHVSSGIYAASDYATVAALPNQMTIGEVVGGEQGYIRLRNPEAFAVDIGGWVLEDVAARYLFPPQTMIGARADAAFANAVTGLRPAARVILRYPDQSIALESDTAFPPAEPQSADEAEVTVFTASGHEEDVPVVASAVAQAAAHIEISDMTDESSATSSVSLYAAAGRGGESISNKIFFMLAALLSALAGGAFLVLKRSFFV